MTFRKKRLAGIVIGVGLLLLIRFLSMRFTGAPNWSTFDFVAAAVVLLGAGLAIEFALRMVKSTRYRIAICAAILLGLFILWVEIAVGLFGTRFAGS